MSEKKKNTPPKKRITLLEKSEEKYKYSNVQKKSEFRTKFVYFIPKSLAISTHILMCFPGKIYLHNNTSNRLHGASSVPCTPFPVTGTNKIRSL